MKLREWYYTQHVRPEVQEAFEKLFALPDKLRAQTNKLDHATAHGLLIAAMELEAILGAK
jgi:hypothetical protein